MRWVNLRGEVEHVYPDTCRVWLTLKGEYHSKPPSSERDLFAYYGDDLTGLA